MGVESAADLASFFDTDDHGVAASYTPSGGAPATVNGIFDREFTGVDPGSSVEVDSDQPRFTCAEADVAGAARDDTLVVGGTTYRVAVVQPDGTGVVTLVLEET